MKLGASGMGRASNECRLASERVVIKCANIKTTSVGVTYQMLERLDRIVGAFKLDDGSFELWSLLPSQFKSAMRDSRSHGSSTPKVGLVARSIFESLGKPMGRVRIADPE
jgi:hypothetical protein